jgi:hypothetical protein
MPLPASFRRRPPWRRGIPRVRAEKSPRCPASPVAIPQIAAINAALALACDMLTEAMNRESDMRTTIAIGVMGLALLSNRAAAQTAVEKAQILRDFQQSVTIYTQQRDCLALFPEASTVATTAPKVFTPPVAMVFRQLIAAAVTTHHKGDVSMIVIEALPALPAALQYRLSGNDLEIRNVEEGVIVAVLKDAFGAITAKD